MFCPQRPSNARPSNAWQLDSPAEMTPGCAAMRRSNSSKNPTTAWKPPEPGGTVNIITKKPQFKEQGSVALSGGSWQTLASTPNLQLAITADSNWILYHAMDSAGNQALFRVPTTGGASERLGSFPSSSYLGSMEISNDGRHIVTASYDYGHGFELWALDNFMPTASKR